VEVDVALASGAKGRGAAPAGASRGSHEAVDLRDGGTALAGQDVQGALEMVRSLVAPRLLGMDVRDQQGIDEALIELDGTPNKSRLGGNTTIATSLAAAHAAAAHAHEPLWRYLADGGPVTLPLPEVQIFGGGAHAGRRVDIQDFLVMPLGAESFQHAMVMTSDVYRAAGALMMEGVRLRGGRRGRLAAGLCVQRGGPGCPGACVGAVRL